MSIRTKFDPVTSVTVVEGATMPRHPTGRGAPRRHDALYHWIPKLEPGQEIRVPYSRKLRASALAIAKKLGVKIFTSRDNASLRIYRPRPEDANPQEG